MMSGLGFVSATVPVELQSTGVALEPRLSRATAFDDLYCWPLVVSVTMVVNVMQPGNP